MNLTYQNNVINRQEATVIKNNNKKESHNLNNGIMAIYLLQKITITTRYVT